MSDSWAPATALRLVLTLVAAGAGQFDSSPIAAWAPSGKALSGVVAAAADPTGAGSCRFQGHVALTGSRAPPTWRLNLHDDRQDHRAPPQALVDELGHVVVEVVLQQVDLA